MWRDLISEVAASANFAPPITDAELAQAAATLGGSLPEPLVDLLRESNGVEGEHGLGLVWPLERIVQDNILFRSNPDFAEIYMPFDPLLFFADAGNGDQFAFVWTPRRDEVFVWDHESDSRRWVAQSLERYIEWWLTGRIVL